MTKSDELAHFHDWAIKRDLMYSLSWGADHLWEVEIVSAAESECYYEKKVCHLDEFINRWEKRLNDSLPQT